MIITIFGASGLVGSAVLANLLNDSKITKVYSVGRKKLDRTSDKLEQILLDPMKPEAIEDIEHTADCVICCLGTTIKTAGSKDAFRFVDYELTLAAGTYAKKQNAKFSVVSAMGANSNSHIFYNKVKGELEDALEKLELKYLSIFRPSLLIGERSESRLAEGIAIKLYHFSKSFLSEKLKRKLGTGVSLLATKILNDLKENKSGKQIYEAVDIK